MLAECAAATARRVTAQTNAHIQGSANAGPVALQPRPALQLLRLRARLGRPQHDDTDRVPLLHGLPPLHADM